MALAQALLPYLVKISEHGLEGALRSCRDLVRGTYTHAGACVRAGLAEALGIPYHPLEELLSRASPPGQAARS